MATISVVEFTSLQLILTLCAISWVDLVIFSISEKKIVGMKQANPKPYEPWALRLAPSWGLWGRAE